MNVEQIVEYAVGYVGATVGKGERRTRDIDRAREWTRSHTSTCDLAVCQGLPLADCNCEQQHDGYIAEHMNENIIGYEGAYTNLYLSEVEKLAV